MTTRDFIELIGRYPLLVLACCAALPLLAFCCGLLHGKGQGAHAPWKYLYAVLVYLACIPGLFCSVIVAYTLFFTHENLLNVDPLVYFGPIAAMIITLVLVNHRAALGALPGVNRLSSFMIIIAVSFAVILAIEKTFIGIIFFANFFHLLLIGLGIFLVLKWATSRLFRGPDEKSGDMPEIKMPEMKL